METGQILPQPPPAVGVQPVDESFWFAVAGPGVEIASHQSYVYYFPQGHLEQSEAMSIVNDHIFPILPSMIHCQVISVQLEFDAVSEEPFAKFILQPTGLLRGGEGSVRGYNDNDFVYFVKTLTPSDMNALWVPKYWANKIFPQLDCEKEAPAQSLSLTDPFQDSWTMEHVYGGDPLHHQLTAGWFQYVVEKYLISGDSVVLMRRKSTNELFIGIRRADKLEGSSEEEVIVTELQKAVKRMSFQICYYPRMGVPNFVVLAEKVERSLLMGWKFGMAVTVGVDSDDARKSLRTPGYVNAAEPPVFGEWRGSPWRMIEVCFYIYYSRNCNLLTLMFLQVKTPMHMKKVSPWEVEIDVDAPLRLKRKKTDLSDYSSSTAPNNVDEEREG